MWIVDGCWRQDNNDLIFDMACAAIINSADLHLFSSHWRRARSPHLFGFFKFLDGGLNEMEFNSWRIQKDISAGGDYWEISRNSPEEISNIILLHLQCMRNGFKREVILGGNLEYCCLPNGHPLILDRSSWTQGFHQSQVQQSRKTNTHCEAHCEDDPVPKWQTGRPSTRTTTSGDYLITVRESPTTVISEWDSGFL